MTALRQVKLEEGALVEGDKLKEQMREALEAEMKQIQAEVY